MPRTLLEKETDWTQTVQEPHEICQLFVCLMKTGGGQICVHLVLTPSKKMLVEKMEIESDLFETDLVMIGLVHFPNIIRKRKRNNSYEKQV